MCSCGLQNRASFVEIAKQDKSSLPMLKYLHCKYQDQFEALFAEQGINATEPNLKALSNMADTGGDLAGKVTGKDGKPIYFSVEQTLKKIDPNNLTNNNCSI